MSTGTGLYTVSPITSTSNVAPFDRTLDVYGLTLLGTPAVGGAAAVSDYFMVSVSNVIQEILSPDVESIDTNLQESVLAGFAAYNISQKIGYTGPSAYNPSIVDGEAGNNYPGLDQTNDQNPNVDYIWEGTESPETEVIEHLLHTITEFGFTYASPSAMDPKISTSDVRLAMQEAIDNGVFDVADYSSQNDGSSDYYSLLAREYLYLLTYAEWGFIEKYIDGGTLSPEWSPVNASDVMNSNPLGHNLFLNHISKMISAPDQSSLTKVFYGKYLTKSADALIDGSTSSLIYGRNGDDTLSGGAGNDLIYGNKDADRLVGGGGADTLFGGQQSDTVFGLSGADQVYGNKQDDTLHGGLGDDNLFGGQQDDLLYGQFGNDRIDGNRGNDTLYGEDGIDTFVISKGDDWVMDFNTAQDKIETADAYSAITQSVSSGNLVLTDSDGDTLTLLGVTSTLSEGYFV